MEDELLHKIFGVSKSHHSTKTELKGDAVFILKPAVEIQPVGVGMG
jgi:hypothetical protein